MKTGAKIEAEKDTRSLFPKKNAPSAFLEYPADGDGGGGLLGELSKAHDVGYRRMVSTCDNSVV